MTGQIGQFKGPFEANEIITLDSEHSLRLGISIGEKDSMSSNWELLVQIDNKEILVKYQLIYNPDAAIDHHTIVFPNGAPASTIVDYMILE